MKVAINCNWAAPKTQIYDGHTVAINQSMVNPDYIVDYYPVTFSSLASSVPPQKRALAFGEPSIYLDYKNGLAERFNDFYKGGLLTWHKELREYPQYKPYVFGMSWVSNFPVSDKTFGISGVFSSKADPRFEGYAIRRNIEAAEKKYTVPTMVYSPQESWLGKSFKYPIETKHSAFDYMFHWSIENCQEDDYFTEKLIDCFVMETVPIYWGDPKVSSRFVSDGIIIFDKDNFVNQANLLTPDDYKKRIPAIKENKKRAFKYIDTFKNILLSLLGKNI